MVETNSHNGMCCISRAKRHMVRSVAYSGPPVVFPTTCCDQFDMHELAVTLDIGAIQDLSMFGTTNALLT